MTDHCNVMVARVVCRTNQGSVPVRVINVTNEALTLKEEMKLGLLHTDIEVANKADHLGVMADCGASPGSRAVDTFLTHLGLHQKGFEALEMAAIRDLLYAMCQFLVQVTMTVFKRDVGVLCRNLLCGAVW